MVKDHGDGGDAAQRVDEHKTFFPLGHPQYQTTTRTALRQNLIFAAQIRRASWPVVSGLAGQSSHHLTLQEIEVYGQ